MSGAEAGISTRLVKGSDLAQGKRVRVLAGTYAGTEATVHATADREYGRFVADSKGWGLGWYKDSELEPLEGAEQ